MTLFCRNIPAKIRDTQPDVVTQDGQEIKVCVRTYRLFYVPETEDFLWKFRSKEEMEEAAANLKKRNALREKWMDKSRLAVVAPSNAKDKIPAAEPPPASTSKEPRESPTLIPEPAVTV